MASQKQQYLSAWYETARRAAATSDHLSINKITKSSSSPPSLTGRSACTSQASSFTTTTATSDHRQQHRLPLRPPATPDPPTSTTSTTPSKSVVMAVGSKQQMRTDDPSLHSLTQFMNANLIQQKRLKANHSQITMVTKQFRDQKAQYELSFTTPPTTTSAIRGYTTFAIRAQMYANLQKFCTRYDSLLDLRRQMLEKQQAWLEAAMDAPIMKDSMQLGLAIDMQIEAAKELAVMEKEAKLKSVLEILRRPS